MNDDGNDLRRCLQLAAVALLLTLPAVVLPRSIQFVRLLAFRQATAGDQHVVSVLLQAEITLQNGLWQDGQPPVTV